MIAALVPPQLRLSRERSVTCFLRRGPLEIARERERDGPVRLYLFLNLVAALEAYVASLPPGEPEPFFWFDCLSIDQHANGGQGSDWWRDTFLLAVVYTRRRHGHGTGGSARPRDVLPRPSAVQRAAVHPRAGRARPAGPAGSEALMTDVTPGILYY